MSLVIKGPGSSTKSTVYWLMIILTFTMGYCETTTFCTSGFLSNHVFFNIPIVGYQLFHKSGSFTWLPILVIPIFTFSLFSSMWLINNGVAKITLYRIAGLLLFLSDIMSILFTINGVASTSWSCIAAALTIVIAMGMLSSPKPLSERKNWLNYGFITIVSPLILNKNLKIVSGKLLFPTFVLGCLTGIIAASLLGLSGAILPGVLLILLTTG